MHRYFQEKNIPIQNILSALTDGAPVIKWYHAGFIVNLKHVVPNVHLVYCVIHYQHLITNNLSEHLHKLLH